MAANSDILVTKEWTGEQVVYLEKKSTYIYEQGDIYEKGEIVSSVLQTRSTGVTSCNRSTPATAPTYSNAGCTTETVFVDCCATPAANDQSMKDPHEKQNHANVHAQPTACVQSDSRIPSDEPTLTTKSSKVMATVCQRKKGIDDPVR